MSHNSANRHQGISVCKWLRSGTHIIRLVDYQCCFPPACLRFASALVISRASTGEQEAAALRLKQWQATAHARERTWLDRRIKHLYAAMELHGRSSRTTPSPQVCRAPRGSPHTLILQQSRVMCTINMCSSFLFNAHLDLYRRLRKCCDQVRACRAVTLHAELMWCRGMRLCQTLLDV